MPTEIMDDYLEGLEEPERELIEFLVEPFYSTARSLADHAIFDESILEEEVDLGPVVAIARGTTPGEVAEMRRALLINKERIITSIADAEFEEEFLSKKPKCLLPQIDHVRTMSRKNTIFALLVAAHDEDCDLCNLNSDDNFEENEISLADFVADMSVADQQFLVDHASRIRMLILSKMTFSERHKLFEELRTNDPPEVVYKRCGESCLLATALTTEYLLWMTKRPYLLWSAIRHTAICRETHERFAEFEKSHSAFLSPSKRALYERWASTLMSGISRNLFNVVR